MVSYPTLKQLGVGLGCGPGKPRESPLRHPVPLFRILRLARSLGSTKKSPVRHRDPGVTNSAEQGPCPAAAGGWCSLTL